MICFGSSANLAVGAEAKPSLLSKFESLLFRVCTEPGGSSPAPNQQATRGAPAGRRSEPPTTEPDPQPPPPPPVTERPLEEALERALANGRARNLPAPLLDGAIGPLVRRTARCCRGRGRPVVGPATRAPVADVEATEESRPPKVQRAGEAESVHVTPLPAPQLVPPGPRPPEREATRRPPSMAGFEGGRSAEIQQTHTLTS